MIISIKGHLLYGKKASEREKKEKQNVYVCVRECVCVDGGGKTQGEEGRRGVNKEEKSICREQRKERR